MSKVVLISCVSKKLPQQAKAKDLYISPLFKFNLAFARTLQPDKIFILSAKYGLVGLEQKLDPYEQTLNTMPIAEVKLWADKVRGQMRGKVNLETDEITFLAGERYRKYLLPYCKKAKVPLQGLSIGKQLHYLKHHTSHV